ncbi:MAG: hypothetical protein FWG74_03260 [Planctomycetes bacterium]|nr:hypothetical protein [Planctomycetota bacterium]
MAAEKWVGWLLNMGLSAIHLKMDALTEREIRTRLVPMLSRKEAFDFSAARQVVRNYLTELLTLPDNEKRFLDSFRNGEYRPGLLFADDAAERVRDHPMAAWKIRHHGINREN